MALFLGLSSGCGVKTENTDAMKFKEEYESLNGTINASGNEHRTVSIDKENPYVYATPQEILDKIENKETFYVYFGSSYCPWCRSVIETSIKEANKNDIDVIYYIDIWDGDHKEILRDTYELNDKGKAVLAQSGTEEYQKLLKALDPVLKEYTLKNEKGKTVSVGEKRIFAPNFIYVEKGVATRLENGYSEKQTDSRMDLTDEMLADETTKFDEFFAN